MVGVGSVGTRCWVALFVGRDHGDPLFLQIKEAEAAVGEPFLGAERVRPPRASGWSRASGSCRAPATSSSGGTASWATTASPATSTCASCGTGRLSADVDQMPPEVLGIYAQMCGWTLARAHARSGDAIAMGAYLGGGDRFDRAMCEFAATYADQNQRDFEALTRAIANGSRPGGQRRLTDHPAAIGTGLDRFVDDRPMNTREARP